ncbi:MAG: GPR endopeptidase [Firmicutes bacterium]|nr:GPR endopeptidase [Bacillota bacterium]
MVTKNNKTGIKRGGEAQSKGANTLNRLKKIRSDMAMELLDFEGFGTYRPSPDPYEVKRSEIIVDKKLSKKIGKAEGTYITLESGAMSARIGEGYEPLRMAICDAIKKLAPRAENVLVVCLGNPNLTADALGSRVFENLKITRSLPEEIKPQIILSALCPNVFGATGIESFDIIKGVVERISPQLIIAVDSLASAAVGRIASAFQLCSSGITPGSGVANHRIRLDKSSLGADVVSIGVPLVVYASTIIAEAAGEKALKNAGEDIMNLIVTPKDIDVLVENCAEVIAAGINRAFG